MGMILLMFIDYLPAFFLGVCFVEEGVVSTSFFVINAGSSFFFGAAFFFGFSITSYLGIDFPTSMHTPKGGKRNEMDCFL
jgi:hypothetical protein